MELQDRVVVVTGAGSGIGAATCRVLAERGDRVLCVDIDPEKIAQLEKGEAEKAEESFRQALEHFAGDPRTALSQAQAYLGLGEALALQEEEQEAREALAQAAVVKKVSGSTPVSEARAATPL